MNLDTNSESESSELSEDFLSSGPPTHTPVVAPSTSLDDTQDLSSMGLKLLSASESLSRLLPLSKSKACCYRFRHEPFHSLDD